MSPQLQAETSVFALGSGQPGRRSLQTATPDGRTTPIWQSPDWTYDTVRQT
jgi:hypothetical protein